MHWTRAHRARFGPGRLAKHPIDVGKLRGVGKVGGIVGAPVSRGAVGAWPLSRLGRVLEQPWVCGVGETLGAAGRGRG